MTGARMLLATGMVAGLLSGCGSTRLVEMAGETMTAEKGRFVMAEPWDHCRKQPAARTILQAALAEKEQCRKDGSCEFSQAEEDELKAQLAEGASAGATAGIVVGSMAGVSPSSTTDVSVGMGLGLLNAIIVHQSRKSIENCIDLGVLVTVATVKGETKTVVMRGSKGLEDVHDKKHATLEKILMCHVPAARFRPEEEVYFIEHDRPFVDERGKCIVTRSEFDMLQSMYGNITIVQ